MTFRIRLRHVRRKFIRPKENQAYTIWLTPRDVLTSEDTIKEYAITRHLFGIYKGFDKSVFLNRAYLLKVLN